MKVSEMRLVESNIKAEPTIKVRLFDLIYCLLTKIAKKKRGANIQLQMGDKIYAHIELQCNTEYSVREIPGYFNRSLNTGKRVSAL